MTTTTMKRKNAELTEDDKVIIRRALSRHYRALFAAADKCTGSLYPRINLGEATRTAELLRKLLGPDEQISDE